MARKLASKDVQYQLRINKIIIYFLLGFWMSTFVLVSSLIIRELVYNVAIWVHFSCLSTFVPVLQYTRWNLSATHRTCVHDEAFFKKKLSKLLGSLSTIVPSVPKLVFIKKWIQANLGTESTRMVSVSTKAIYTVDKKCRFAYD